LLAGRILVVAFEGWNDATEGASGALKAISEQLEAVPMEAVDPEDYYDFQFSRPMLERDEDGNRNLIWPGTQMLHASKAKIAENPDFEKLYLLLGIEPSRRWMSFAAEILEMVEDREVDTVVMLGAMLADAPHTRPMPIFKSSNHEPYQKLLSLESSNYEGPVGILTVLSAAFESSGIPVLSLWGSVPHYVHNSSNPKAALGFVTELQDLLGLSFETSELAEAAFEWERGIDDIAEGDEEMAAYVASLEKNRDELDSVQASGDSLAREFEKYLSEKPEEES